MKNMAQRENTQTFTAAVYCGDWVVVRDLLCDEDVDVADSERCLVLHKLASPSNISLSLVEDIVDKILSRDVNINMADNNGDTAVMAAARCENWKVVWLLMSREGTLLNKDHVIAFLRILGRSEYMNKNCGLSVNILLCLRDSLKQTIPECHHRAIHEVLIHVAAKVNCWWLVRDLLTADIANTLDEEGLGLVHRLAKGGMNHHIYLLNKLLENGGDINLKNVDGDTATHVAVKSKNWKMMEVLLQSGARTDIFNNDNHTVFHLVPIYLRSVSEIWKSADTIFSLLQKNCSNIDAREGGGDTVLQLAVKERNSLIAEKLMIIGARANVQDGNGRTVLHTMATHKREYSSLLLKQAIACGAGLEIKDSEGNTALHLAAKLGNWGYVNDLIAHGAVVTEPDSDGCTVYDRIFTDKSSYIYLDTPFLKRFPLDMQLHLSVKLSRWNVLDELVKKGACVNLPDPLGFTVLQRLAQMESMKGVDNVFGFLVNRGANLTVQTPEGDNLLQLAAKHKNWFVVERMLNQQFSPLEPDSEGLTVLDRLAQCIYRGRTLPALLSLLYDETAVISSLSPNDDILLQLAAKHGNIPMMEHLIQEDDVANINQVDSEGFSVIHRTVQYESKYTEDNIGSVVNLLLSKGANPRLRSSVGDTALHLAARHNNWDIVECLVEHGCDLNEPDSEGFYVLHRLAQTIRLRHPKGKSHKEMCEALFVMFVTKGADVFVRTSAGDSVIQLAAKHGNWKIVEHLVKLECEVNELDSEGWNVLHRLVQTTQRRQVLSNSSETPEDTLFRSLLNKGTNVSVRTSAGDSVMQLATKHGKWKIVERLLELEWDVNELDSEGYNVLHRFAQTTQQTQVQDDIFFSTLINKGADVSVQCRTGDTALHLAAKCNNWTIALLLVHQGCDMNQPDSEGCYILHRIAQDVLECCKSLDTQFSILLDKGACQFVRNQSGDTVLHVAAKHRKWTMVEHLVEREANINEPDSEGFHILHRLAQEPDERILELLVVKGINLNCRCPNIGTALHMAVKEQKWSFAERLVEFGADVNERDLEGLSILHIIASQKMDYRSHDFTQLIHLLISKDADVTARSPSGDSVFHLAARYDNWEIIEQLLAHKKDRTDCQRLTSVTS
ncbi:ankyrin-2-like [Pomacea canaliculata]|uniref:ankyrin-2-like n=1 Tax=Pomacea canaliculata TaxID=400727 RepID=UPI000D731251|nr:ankyrin-2-like [Pomacea canaliculata]XP_025087288.1 ankyrin-2-like [Pomacea canaliculata]XP_025087289.1 ankyrin-2-like [Pomacea canaliculata]